MQQTWLTLWKQYLAEQDTRDVTRNEPGNIAAPDQPNWPMQPDTNTMYPSYDEYGNKIPWGDIKGFSKKAEVAVNQRKQQHGNSADFEAYFFRMKSRGGDSGDAPAVVMYLPDSGKWIDVDTNTEIMKSQSGFSERRAMQWLRKNGYLKQNNPRA